MQGPARRGRVPVAVPDGKRIAFKSRIGDQTAGASRSSTLATLEDHPVAEKRSIDDQVEWLDDDTLVYSNGTNVYTVPADGSGEAKLLDPRRELARCASKVVKNNRRSGSLVRHEHDYGPGAAEPAEPEAPRNRPCAPSTRTRASRWPPRRWRWG